MCRLVHVPFGATVRVTKGEPRPILVASRRLGGQLLSLEDWLGYDCWQEAARSAMSGSLAYADVARVGHRFPGSWATLASRVASRVSVLNP